MKGAKGFKVMSEPKYLYHYTNFEGLKGIVDSQQLWFSDYRSMNDPREFMQSEGLIKDCIEDAIKEFMSSRGYSGNCSAR